MFERVHSYSPVQGLWWARKRNLWPRGRRSVSSTVACTLRRVRMRCSRKCRSLLGFLLQGLWWARKRNLCSRHRRAVTSTIWFAALVQWARVSPKCKYHKCLHRSRLRGYQAPGHFDGRGQIWGQRVPHTLHRRYAPQCRAAPRARGLGARYSHDAQGKRINRCLRPSHCGISVNPIRERARREFFYFNA